jgi:DNA-binding transcriptional regulator YhcF (GntR family)
MLISNQIRAARGLLRWSARMLAEEAGVHLSTVQRMERTQGEVGGNVESVRRVQTALERAGVVFLAEDDSPGVRLNNLGGAANKVRAARARRALSGKDKTKGK